MQDMLDRQAYIDQNMQKKSPFDAGVMRAVKSAKQSLSLDEDQSDRATREGLYGFSEALQQDQAPMAKGGILGRLATAARGVPSGMRAYDQAEAAARNENSVHADMVRRFRAGEEAKIAKMEQEAYIRDMNDRKMALEQQKLNEERDYHKNSLFAKLAKAAQERETREYHNLDFIPITKDTEAKPYKEAKREFGTSLSKLKEIKSRYDDFREKYKNNVIDPMSPWSTVANPTKDFIGKYGNSKVLRDETSDRKALNSMLNEFIIQNENALRGGGVLGPKLIQVFKDMNIYPSLEKDTPEDFLKKLSRMEEETQKYYDTANYSLKHNVHLDPHQLDDFKNRYPSNENELVDVTPQAEKETNNNIDSIRLYNPNSNEYFNIPANDLSQVMRDYPNLVIK